MFHPTTTGFPLSLPRTRCALAAALVCFSYCGSSAYAQQQQQQSAEPTQTLERVTVTGSTIKRLDRETAQPLQILRREDIANAIGANSVGQLLDTLTTNDRTAISDLGGANSWASGASSIFPLLRNLGVGGTSGSWSTAGASRPSALPTA